MKKSAKPSLVTRQQLAKLMNADPRSISKWQEEGLPVAKRGRGGRASLYDEVKARAWKASRDESATTTGFFDVAQERARKERAQAVLAEQTYKVRSRELLPAAEVEKAWNAEVQAVRAAILASYTTQADKVHRAAVRGVAAVEAVLKDLAHEILRELAAPERSEPAA